MIYLRFLACMAVALGLSVSPVQSQSGVVAEPATFRIFSPVGWFHDLKFDVGVSAKGVGLQVGDKPGTSYPLPAGGQLVIYREIPVPAGAPNGTLPRKEAVARVSVPPTQHRTLIALIPGPNNTFTARAINDALDKIQAGTLRLINFSSMPAIVALNDKLYPLSVGAEEVAPYRNGGTLIRVAVQVQNGSGWATAFRIERIARPTRYGYGFVFDYMPDPGVPDMGPPPAALFRLFMDQAPVVANPQR